MYITVRYPWTISMKSFDRIVEWVLIICNCSCSEVTGLWTEILQRFSWHDSWCWFEGVIPTCRGGVGICMPMPTPACHKVVFVMIIMMMMKSKQCIKTIFCIALAPLKPLGDISRWYIRKPSFSLRISPKLEIGWHQTLCEPVSHCILLLHGNKLDWLVGWSRIPSLIKYKFRQEGRQNGHGSSQATASEHLSRGMEPSWAT